MAPVINCEDEYMEAIIDKNMLKAKNWNGDNSNIFLSGPGSSLMGLDDVDPNCFSVTDNDGNYILRVNAPFMNQCGTQSDIIGDDYEFSNVVKWRYDSLYDSQYDSFDYLDMKVTQWMLSKKQMSSTSDVYTGD